MSTSEWRRRADSRSTSTIVLVQVDLRANGAYPARTLRMATRHYTDSAGDRWDGLIAEELNLDAGGGFLESSWQPVDTDLVLHDRRVSFQGAGETLSLLFSQYILPGSAVTIWQGFLDLALANFQVILSDAEVAEPASMQAGRVRLHVVQERKWIVSAPPRKATRLLFPNLPDDAIGLPLPIVFGVWNRGRRNFDSTAPTITVLTTETAGIMRGSYPLLMVDTATATGFPQYFVSDRQLHTTGLTYTVKETQFGRLAKSTGSATTTNPAGGPSTLTPISRQFSVAISAIDKHASTNASGWNDALRETKDFKLSGYLQLDHDAVQRVLRLTLPEITSPPGDFVSARVYCFYAKNASAGSHPRFGIVHAGTGNDFTDFPSAATTYPATVPAAAEIALLTKITDWSDIPLSTIYAETQLATQLVRIFRIILWVEYTRQRTLLREGVQSEGPEWRVDASGRQVAGNPGASRMQFGTGTFHRGPDLYEYRPELGHFSSGVPDDGSGTYTGSAGAVIEHPAGVGHYILKDIAGFASSDFVTAASTFGSFTDIRTSLANYKAMMHMAEDRSVAEYVADIGAQFLIWFYRSTTQVGAPWMAVPWLATATANYRSAADVFRFSATGPNRIIKGSFNVTTRPMSSVATEVRVKFNQDPSTKTYADEVYITGSDSYGWNGTAQARDQNTTAPDNRETLSAARSTAYGTRSFTHSMPYCSDPYTATHVRNRLFDLISFPRVVVRFGTYVNAADLERGQIIEFDSSCDDIVRYPGVDSDGSWANKKFQVGRITRRNVGATAYEIEAVQI
jgi:hypothetical protein